MTAQPEALQSEVQYDVVKKYYGEVVQNSSDLKTNACCVSEPAPARLSEALLLINDEIKAKYYGCGSPIPLCIEDLKILDLGCGT
ncbi:MAG: methyltransferase domain-containing protein, partial [Planctomycetota bacterium]